MQLLFRVLFGVCCLVSSAFASPSISLRFLTISDIHYGSKNNSMDGQNVGDNFLAVSMSKFQELSKNVDFVITLGDLPTHLMGISLDKELYEKTVFHDLFESNSQKKPMFYISGNNDSLGGNYQPFDYQGKTPLNFANDWTGACVYCEGLIIDDSHMQSHGYYSTYVVPNNKDVMLIVLNATQWTITPKYAAKYPNQDEDAKEQLSWLKDQLHNNSAKQLLIAIHEPPGKAYNGALIWKNNYLQEFVKLLDQNQTAYGQITLLSSHTHMDEIRKIGLSNHKNVYDYATPAVSRVHMNNSGMKIFELDDKMTIANYITYYTTSITQWNNDSYQALNAAKSIFARCLNKNLEQCLDSLTDDQVCLAMEAGRYYGVKSNRVNNRQCRVVYKVN
ncbi:MAG: metallophosphatase [Legionella sp.]|nr:MAG: metallophosphatase [Legionella sp.]